MCSMYRSIASGRRCRSELLRGWRIFDRKIQKSNSCSSKDLLNIVDGIAKDEGYDEGSRGLLYAMLRSATRYHISQPPKSGSSRTQFSMFLY